MKFKFRPLGCLLSLLGAVATAYTASMTMGILFLSGFNDNGDPENWKTFLGYANDMSFWVLVSVVLFLVGVLWAFLIPTRVQSQPKGQPQPAESEILPQEPEK